MRLPEGCGRSSAPLVLVSAQYLKSRLERLEAELSSEREHRKV
jgi:hypothetical protein